MHCVEWTNTAWFDPMMGCNPQVSATNVQLVSQVLPELNRARVQVCLKGFLNRPNWLLAGCMLALFPTYCVTNWGGCDIMMAPLNT